MRDDRADLVPAVRRPKRGKMKKQRLLPHRIRHKSAQFRLRIGRSRIHRLGVFALEDIPVGRDVIEYTGKRLSQRQAAKLKPPHDDYVIGSDLGPLIDARASGSGAELVNHSCDPNLLWRQRRARYLFYSRRSILAGEELTIYYGYPVKARRLPCLCGARKCRGTFRYIAQRGGAMKSRRSALRRIRPRFARYALGVGPSKIHGSGVYALEYIPARHRVVEYTGKPLTTQQAVRLKFPKDIYLAGTAPGSFVNGGVCGSGAQFVNHSCHPNLKFVWTAGQLFFVSLRNIRAGEELTCWYGHPAKPKRVPCRCNARNCRGTLRLIFG